MCRLNITLGHNSAAAIFNEDGECLCAYEEERLTKVKSDSSFPKLAIEECLSRTGTSAYDITNINISHWFNTEVKDDKYCQPKYLERRFPNAKISDTLTHHDNHAYSVWNFSGSPEGVTFVIDGFGNNEECISVYTDGKLVHRVRGYENSLGLMYQYATSAASLKENEDEYKLLGYEIQSEIQPEVLAMPIHIIGNKQCEDLIDYNKLRVVKEYWHLQLQGMTMVDIAKTVQYTLEQRVMKLISQWAIPGEQIQLSGGVFYNVKLNNLIMRTMPPRCKLIVNPVCGDQGNVFGTPFLHYTSLNLGKRDITPHIPLMQQSGSIQEFFVGNMEFGPRALCNTSTIAPATLENVETINGYNNRNTVMPMAPVVTRDFFLENFEDTEKAIGSEKYMVISFDFKTMRDEWRGGAHFDPVRNVYTGRVQVVDPGDFIYPYVKHAGGIMINTSLNYHGTPILLNDNDYHQYRKLINDTLR